MTQKNLYGRSSRLPRDAWIVGKRDLPAVCPTCRQNIRPGAWVCRAPGRGRVLAHAYTCPRGR